MKRKPDDSIAVTTAVLNGRALILRRLTGDQKRRKTTLACAEELVVFLALRWQVYLHEVKLKHLRSFLDRKAHECPDVELASYLDTACQIACILKKEHWLPRLNTGCGRFRELQGKFRKPT